MKVFTSFGLIWAILWVYSPLKAQHLRHKGTLGLECVEASDSLLNSLKFPETMGVVVKRVSPNFTASALGIEPNDILVAINDINSLDLLDFKKIERELNEQEPIAITYIRGRKKNRVVGQVLARQRESSLGEVIYGEVAYQQGYLRTIVHKPYGTARFPAVFYLQSYDCGSIDFAQDSLSPIKKMVDGWVKAGYAVYRVEKPGVGEGIGTKVCAQLSYKEELKAFENAFSTLKKLPFIDSTHVFLFGHSLGGIAAPLVASQSKYKPRGIMVYGTVVKPWFEYMMDVFRKQPLLYKEPIQNVELNTRMMTPLLFEWLVQGRSASDLLTVPDFEAILTSKENPLSYQRGTFFGRLPSYFSDINRYNLAQAWAKAAVPTLAIHGEFDSQAISPEAAQNIAQIVNEVRPGKGTFRLLKGSDHTMIKVTSFEEYHQLRKSGKYKEYAHQNFNPDIVEMTVNWMKQQ